jgi:DNA (cytosine-5)-methyltransferase 1
MDGAAIASATRFRYVEACAGAGGMGLGLHMAGWTGTGMELDPDAVATHNANVGPCLAADITTASAPHAADLLAAGVPCQPFSMAGLGEGLGCDRGNLFRSALRLAREADVRATLVENVLGMRLRGALPVVLDAFRAHGFYATSATLHAERYGVPQARRRVFIVGFRDAADLARFRWPAPTHAAPGEMFGLPAFRTFADAVGLPAGIADVLDRPSSTITAGGTDGGTHTGGAEVFANGPYRKRLRAALHRAGSLPRAEGSSLTLPVAWCAALQGFPAGFVFHGGITAQHRQNGNSVPPALAAALGRSIATALYGGAP